MMLCYLSPPLNLYIIVHYPYKPRRQHASHCHWSHTYPLNLVTTNFILNLMLITPVRFKSSIPDITSFLNDPIGIKMFQNL